MPPATSSRPAGAPARPGGGGRAGGPLGMPWWAWGLAGVGAVVGYIWYRNRQANAAATAAAAQGAGNAVGAASTPYGPAYGGGNSGGDLATLAALLSSQGQGGTTTPAPFTPTPTTTEAIVKDPKGNPTAGYGGPAGSAIGSPIISSSGVTYQQIPNWQTLAALQQSGAQIFYQPVQGVFQPVGNATLPPYTPVYIAS